LLLLDPAQQVPHCRCRPLAAPCRWDLPAIKLCGDLAEAGCTTVFEFGHDVCKVRSGLLGSLLDSFRCGCLPGSRYQVVLGFAVPLPIPRYLGSQGRLGALTDQARLKLGNACHLLKHEAPHCAWGYLGKITKDHVNAAVYQSHEECLVAREPIQLGDYQRCLVGTAGCERFGKFRTLAIRLSPRLCLDELSDWWVSTRASEELADRLPLCV